MMFSLKTCIITQKSHEQHRSKAQKQNYTEHKHTHTLLYAPKKFAKLCAVSILCPPLLEQFWSGIPGLLKADQSNVNCFWGRKC
jgi:hypothetical protein